MTTDRGTYHLGIDLGTTYVAAGLLREGRPDIVTLGDRAPVVPSVLFFKEDGSMLAGEPAVRRGVSDPTRVVREFKRRVGDTTPVIVGQTPYSAEMLTARLLRQVHDSVVERQGSRPASIAVTHPANWGRYKIDVLDQAIRMADIGPVAKLTEPEAAAIHYAFTERLDPGQAVAVYDLGGGTFDAAVLRKVNGSFELLGEVEGIERLGGIDFDEAIFQHAMRWAREALDQLDPNEPATLQAIARLREECIAAKEALSTDTDVSIPVLLPNLQTEVRLTRSEFEAMIRPSIAETIEALNRAIRNAGLTPDDLAAVLLVGGSSRIPLIAQMVTAELGRPIAVDQHPKHSVALGAAIAAQMTAAPEPVLAPAEPVIVAAGEPEETPPAQVALPVEAPEPAAVTDTVPLEQVVAESLPFVSDREAAEPKRRPRLALISGVVAALVMIAVVAMALTDRGGNPPAAVESTSTTLDGHAHGTGSEPVTSDGVTSESVPDPTPTTAAPTTTMATTSATTAPTDPLASSDLAAVIRGVGVSGDAYAVEFETNFTPLIADDPSQHHLHFYFDTVPISEAGTPGSGPWILYDGPSPFTQWLVSDRPEGATQMCVTVATHTHAVYNPDNFHCMDLPDA
jgi:actin-like ATPase involved in cell morphogenesis